MATATAPSPTALEVAKGSLQAKADEANKSRSGVGTRIRVGATRGKNPQAISYEAFDESQPDTLPKDLDFFIKSLNLDEKALVSMLIDGYNVQSYTEASDPLAEFVESSWSPDVQKQFRLVVRNYSNATGVSLEDAVKLIKPGIEAAQKK